MTGASLEHRLTNRVRESWIGALVATGAPEHAEETASLMSTHRDAEDELVRTLAWERAIGVASRPYRRKQT